MVSDHEQTRLGLWGVRTAVRTPPLFFVSLNIDITRIVVVY